MIRGNVTSGHINDAVPIPLMELRRGTGKKALQGCRRLQEAFGIESPPEVLVLVTADVVSSIRPL